jgi:hypothetical protein
MSISFLYNGIVAVYYALMALGTTEIIESLALSLIPPGNVLRDISEYRKYLWTRHGIPDARAWFDFPVLTWLGSPVDEAGLATLSEDFVYPFEILEPLRHGASIFLPFSRAIQDFSLKIQETLPGINSSSQFSTGPFEAGLGCHCASIDDDSEPEGAAFASGIRFPLRARTCLLAQVRLTWTPDPELNSSWRVISSARVRGIR